MIVSSGKQEKEDYAMPGKAVTVTLSPYILGELEKLEKKIGLKKSAIVTIALEKYARQEKLEREEVNRDRDK